MPIIRSKGSYYLEKLHKKSKRSFKGPFFYLVVFLTISLFGLLVFSSSLILESPSLRDFSFLKANTANYLPSYDLFAKPAKNFIGESPEMTFLQKNSIVGVSSPAMITPQVLGVDSGDENRKEIIEYVVEPGDNLSSIAEKFGISLNTVLWANDLSQNSTIKLGKKLIILPVSGVIHYVKKDDTISELAATYKADVKEIIEFNELSGEGDVFIGDILIIPNGKMPSLSQPTYYAKVPLGSSYFICPHSACYITQGLHWYNAIDFGGNCGDIVRAAAGGTVQRVGWDKIGGNYVMILHPNEVVTYYGHLSSILVSKYDINGNIVKVSQGGIIGYVGKTGYATGCHVHFDVRGARNPFAK